VTMDDEMRAARERAWARLIAIWEGRAELDELDRLVTSDYVGHLGSRRRTLSELKSDIAAYRAATTNLEFRIARQFAEDDHLATRLTAHGIDAETGVELVAAGLNVSRWSGDQLAEEWAVWEPLHPVL